MAAHVPSQSDLVFSDCGPAAQWLAAMFQMERGHDADAPGYPLGCAHAYLGSPLPDGYRANATTGQLVGWWVAISQSFAKIGERDRPYTRVWEFPYSDCSQEVCQSMDFEGDPDVSGIGITISFWLAALLSTGYFFAVLTDKILVDARLGTDGRPRLGLQHANTACLGPQAGSTFPASSP